MRVAALAACALLGACASASDVELRGRAVLEQTEPERLAYCPAELLAKARTEVAFARAAAERGAPLEAEQHLAAAERHAAGAKAQLVSCGPTRAPVPDGHEPAAPPDADQDGVADALDRCLTEREDRDGFVDEDGCPDLDDDGDGMSDVIDMCPREPEDLDGFEDLDGCPESGP